jgi:hypothetical protein
MRTPAQPRVNFYIQVAPATDKLRRRLQAARILRASTGNRGVAPIREEPLGPRSPKTKQADSPIRGEP